MPCPPPVQNYYVDDSWGCFRALAKGHSGTDVALVQDMLYKWGYYDHLEGGRHPYFNEVDGHFENRTQVAVYLFRWEHYIQPASINQTEVNAKTWEFLQHGMRGQTHRAWPGGATEQEMHHGRLVGSGCVQEAGSPERQWCHVGAIQHRRSVPNTWVRRDQQGAGGWWFWRGPDTPFDVGRPGHPCLVREPAGGEFHPPGYADDGVGGLLCSDSGPANEVLRIV